jgi:ATP-dependent DNA helicase RecG
MTACRDKIRPEIIPYFEMVHEPVADRDVAVVDVGPGYTVHALWHNQRRQYYIRVGSECREASPEELARLFQQRGTVRAELMPVSGSTIDDLDLRRLRDYFGRIRQQELPTDSEGWRHLLVNTELLTESGDRAPATVAGILLFGQAPNRFLPQAGIDAAAYPGDAKEYAVIERAPLRGPMTPLYGGGRLVENGLVEQALDFVRRTTTPAAVIERGGRRHDRLRFPTEPVREAIVNALVHRDYLLSGTDVELSIFSDRLDVVSPGRLPNAVTPERMLAGCRAARNQLLKDAMGDYNYLEHVGMGIPRKVVRGMQKHNGTSPELLAEEERFTLRLFA